MENTTERISRISLWTGNKLVDVWINRPIGLSICVEDNEDGKARLLLGRMDADGYVNNDIHITNGFGFDKVEIS